MMNAASHSADVLIAGAGLIGLGCAVAAAERGLSVLLIGDSRPGESSPAGAGLLAPSIEREEGHASDFAIAARDRYPSYVDWLRERTGVHVPLNRDGIIQLAINEAGARGLQRAMPDTATWLDRVDLTRLEPRLGHGLGGVLHPLDGWTDNVRLLDALRAAAKTYPRIRTVDDAVVNVTFDAVAHVATRDGRSLVGKYFLLATGAWSSAIAGLPREIPVEPVRGQMLSFAASPVGRAVYGPTGYLVPRSDGRTLIGATAERVGFDPVVTPEGVARLRRTASEIIPEFAALPHTHAWAGLRPISADLQPILGADPAEPCLIYATGHSRNGILMTPLTGDCLASLLVGEEPPVSIARFSIARFDHAASEPDSREPSTDI